MSASASETVFETERLLVQVASDQDAALFYDLWTNPQVMHNVGFPQGLPITQKEIQERINNQENPPFDHLLVVRLKSSGESIGECHLHPPDEERIARTDVKLLPAYWGYRYGVEIKRGLLQFLFNHTECIAVEATPNVENAASIKMQEAVGGRRVGEAVVEFPASMQGYTKPVHHYIYRVYRDDWLKSRQEEQGRAAHHAL
ncbi:MAG: GNAT family N-acetyltransferase [Ardenticatenales bacterium]|nr:GNAT family N-acetyltransferase [Ardenticatenales bacterium]